ncbi:MAG: hypothetical protein ABI467_09525 [Kofleriaceae bacterium]
MEIAEQDAVVRTPLEWPPRNPSPRWREAVKLVEVNCLAGDHMSCAALPTESDAHGVTFPAASGALGRSPGCAEPETDRCPEATLRQECEIGFARSCNTLATRLDMDALTNPRTSQQAESDAARKRSYALAAASCRAGVVDDCQFHASPQDPVLELAVSQSECEFGRACGGLAKLYLGRGDLARARDAAERGCQYFAERCAELGVMYLDGTLPEPVAGRGQALVDFVCASLRDVRGDQAMRRYSPCGRARLPVGAP